MDLNWIFDILISPWLSLLFLPLIGYFCWHNVYDYNDLDDCLNTLGANEATTFIPNQQDVNENLTIPSNITLEIIQGGTLNIGKFSIRNATYRWTVSPAQAGEYYLELAAGGDPGITNPLKVYENDVAMTLGTLGALAVGQWNYGNNDALGFNTVYVRIAGTVDPDTKAVDYVEAGYVVTINGHVEAGLYQIFEGSGTAKLCQANVHAEWWGFATAASGAVNAAAIQSAITCFIQVAGYGQPFGGTVHLDRGVYTVAPDVITFHDLSSIVLKGGGSGYGYTAAYYASTQLKFTAGTVGIDISDDDSGTATNFNTLENLRIDGNGVLADGIRISNSQILKRISSTRNTSSGLKILGATNSSHIDESSFFNNLLGAGIRVISSGGFPYTTCFTVKRSNIRGNATGIMMEIGSGVHMSDCVIESNEQYGLMIRMPDTDAARDKTRRLLFEKLWFENNGLAGFFEYQIFIGTINPGQAGDPPKQIRFEDCHLNSGAVDKKYVSINDAEDIEFDNCTFLGSTEATAFLFSAAHSKRILFKTNDPSIGAPTTAQMTGKDVKVNPLILDTPGALTIAGGIIAITSSCHILTPQGGAVDDLDTINGGVDGMLLTLKGDGTFQIDVKHNTGNILLSGAADYLLPTTTQRILLQYDAALTKWIGFPGY